MFVDWLPHTVAMVFVLLFALFKTQYFCEIEELTSQSMQDRLLSTQFAHQIKAYVLCESRDIPRRRLLQDRRFSVGTRKGVRKEDVRDSYTSQRGRKT